MYLLYEDNYRPPCCLSTTGLMLKRGGKGAFGQNFRNLATLSEKWLAADADKLAHSGIRKTLELKIVSMNFNKADTYVGFYVFYILCSYASHL